MSSVDRDAAVAAVNEVRLVGRISGEPQVRELPSGTVLVGFRLVVSRASSPMTTGSKATSDWVECAAWGGRVRGLARHWRHGDEVEVTGALRRRFGGGRDWSRLEVEVLDGRRLRPAGRQTAGQAGRQGAVGDRRAGEGQSANGTGG